MIEFFRTLHDILTFEPNKIFYNTEIHLTKKFDPSFFASNTYDTYTYTKLGQWFEDMPNIFQIIKFPYYLIMWPLWLIGSFIWIIIDLFLPKAWETYRW